VRETLIALLVVLLGGLPVLAHTVEDHPRLVVDCDAGLDDLVALALALQHARVEMTAVVATEGALGRDEAALAVERLLHRMNRSDVGVFLGAGGGGEPPPFRATATDLVRRALDSEAPVLRRPLAPHAYAKEGRKTTVLVLGPLTSLAAALREEPGIREGIEEVIVAGPADPAESWNLSRDPEALATLAASGLPCEFVATGEEARKPERWGEPGTWARATAPAETFLRHLLSIPDVRGHYLTSLGPLHDELAFLYYAESKAFRETGTKGEFAAADRDAVLETFLRMLRRGRQANRRVVLADRPLPDEMLRQDVRARRRSIVAKNGEVEWFSELLMNEIHEHLGAYSVIGVKMGLRAAEILNAPRHAMIVTSRVPAGPPVSCMNDGLIVGTGCTVGRDLFRHEPGKPGEVRATFSYNGREVTLTLKPAYRARIRDTIRGLLEKHTLEDEEYWTGVRELGLTIWEDWHRLDLFEVKDGR
jgi:inosine-uridine nucleoside N-ribohydrolase